MKTLFVDTLEIAVPMSLLIGALLIISPLIKKSFVAKWRYFMWLFVAVRLIFPFKIKTLTAPITVPIPSTISGVAVGSETVSPLSTTSAPMSLQSVLMIVWILGIAVFTAYQLIGYFTFKKSVKRWSKEITDKAMTDILDEICASLGIKRNLRFMMCKTVNTPMVFGLLRPALLLPHCDYNERQLRVILRHEMVHFKRNDILYKLILLVANAICWFNPLVYKMVSTANKDIELTCDAEVVKDESMDYRRDYCRVILSVVHNKQSMTAPLSTCFIISKEVIRERFQGILDLKKKRRGIILFVVVALSVAVSGSIVSFVTQRTAQVLEEDLSIVERPTPKPKPTEPPVETSAPEAEKEPDNYAVYTYNKPVTQSVPQPVYEPVYDKITTEPEPAAEEIENEQITVMTHEKMYVNLKEQSNSIDITFSEAGEVYSSSTSFKGDGSTNMVFVGKGDFTVQVVNDATGEVVCEQNMLNNNSAEFLMEDGGEYSINAIGGESGERASIYVYGK